MWYLHELYTSNSLSCQNAENDIILNLIYIRQNVKIHPIHKLIVEREVPKFYNNCALPDASMILSAFVLHSDTVFI